MTDRQFTDDNWFEKSTTKKTQPLLLAEVEHGANVLEIGCFEGKATLWFLEKLGADRVDCVDSMLDLEVRRRFLSNMSSRLPDEVTLYAYDSLTYLPKLADETYDLIYVDGNHEALYVLSDAVNAFRLCKVGGLIVFDDYKWNKGKSVGMLPPKPAIDAFLKCYQQRVEVLLIDYQVVVRKLAAAERVYDKVLCQDVAVPF